MVCDKGESQGPSSLTYIVDQDHTSEFQMLDLHDILELSVLTLYFLMFKMIIQQIKVLVCDEIIWVPQRDHDYTHQRDKATNYEVI